MNRPDDFAVDVLRLTLAPGIGPVLIGRLIEAFGSPAKVLAAQPASLRTVRGIGPERATGVCKGLREGEKALEAELHEIARRGVMLLARGTAAYPPLLAQMQDAPPLLYVRGRIDSEERGPDRHTCAIVGSRKCTQYGLEQADRFAIALAGAGITVVSGGARGIDTAAHRAALKAGGRTIAVLGCGLSNAYPPDNADLFEQIAGEDGGHGAVVSELPMTTPPTAENFPARNRIIAGLSLGVLVIEASAGSGALITAEQMNDLGREVFALPGRVDSSSSEGSLKLLKEGSAALVTNPGDVLSGLEAPALHAFNGAHAARYPAKAGETREGNGAGLFAPASDDPLSLRGDSPSANGETAPAAPIGLSASQQKIYAALEEPATFDDLVRLTGGDPGVMRGDLTVLEIRRLVKRDGSILRRAARK